MALSKPVAPESLQVIPDIGQHYVECAIKMLVLLQKPKKRKIEPMDTDSKVLKATEKETKQVKEKYEVNETLSLSSFITKVKEFTVPRVCDVFHISLGNSGRVWASINAGSLLQTDLLGNFLEKIKTRGGVEGYHAVTQDARDLIYADKKKKVIKRLTIDEKITTIIRTGDWAPISIHSSNINGDILVGKVENKEAKITRYNKTGTEIQNIQTYRTGEKLYEFPYFITENTIGGE